MRGTFSYLREQVGHFLSHGVITGLILIVSGSTPEHWIEYVIHKIPYVGPDLAADLAGIAFRAFVILLGLFLLAREIRHRRSTWRPSISAPTDSPAEAQRKVALLGALSVDGIASGSATATGPLQLAQFRAVYDSWVPRVETALKRDFTKADLFHFRNQPAPLEPEHGKIGTASVALKNAFEMRSGYIRAMIHRYAAIAGAPPSKSKS